MAVKSVIIIGAGLAGLSAGCYAQMNGYKSRIFEHASTPGGLAAAWKRGEYLIDGGIHFLIAHRPGNPIYDLYREVGTAEPGTVGDMTRYLRFVDETSGESVEFTSDLARLAQDLVSLSPDDERTVTKFIDQVDWLKDSPLLTEMGMGSPPELKSHADTLKELWSMRGFLKYFYGDYSKSAAEFARKLTSPFLRVTFENLFYPDGPIWFVIMILATVAAGQLGLLKEGCPGFVRSIEKRYTELGGHIQYRSTVNEIVIENDRAVGVVLSDGSEHRADVIVSTADGHSTIFELLGGRYVDEKTRKRYTTWKKCAPEIIVSFGVAREFPDDPPLSMFHLKEPISVATHTVNCMPLRILNYSGEFAPEGKTVIQVMLETEWAYWDQLSRDRFEYEGEKNRLSKEILRRLEAHYPGLSSQVEVTDVATPVTTWRYTLNHEGSPMGWLMTKESMMAQIARTLPGLDNFYMAGQWVLPGGGVPACIYSGRHVVQILCRRDGKAFQTHPTQTAGFVDA